MPFLTLRTGKFKLLPAGEVLAQQKIALEMGDYLQLLPQKHGTDGFFAAVMERHITSKQTDSVVAA